MSALFQAYLPLLPGTYDRLRCSSLADGKWTGSQKEEQARLRKRQNELKKVEDKIHELETRDGEIDELLSQEDVYTDVSRLMELNKEKESIQKELEVLYEKWEELAE